jgi:hypothetical protein
MCGIFDKFIQNITDINFELITFNKKRTMEQYVKNIMAFSSILMKVHKFVSSRFCKLVDDVFA